MSSLSNQDDETINIKKGEILFLEGEFSKSLYIIIKGTMQAYKEEQFRLIPVGFFREREFLGIVDVFEDRPYSSTILAYEDTQLLEIKKKDILGLIQTSPYWLYQLLMTLAGRLRGIQDLITEHKLIDSKLYAGIEYTENDEIVLKKKIKERSKNSK